jgi:hypothetical protein
MTEVIFPASYARSGARLLFWSTACFTLLALNNLFLVIDLSLIPSADLQLVRLLLSLSGVAVLLFGFIWESEDNI